MLNERVELGKIESIRIGFGGYQDAMIGVAFTLSGTTWGAVGDFWGRWSELPTKDTKWTRGDQLLGLGETFWRLKELMEAAKVKSVSDLKGSPVRVFFKERNTLYKWEILKEVI